ncbi:hypothetical protein IAT40_004892 [Kwoniella sp. CBS 6097]
MEDNHKPQPRVSTTNLGVGLPSSTYSAAGGTPSWRSGPSPSPTPPVTGMTPTTPLPPPTNVAPRALTERESQLVKHLSRLQFFLATAPTRWMGADDGNIRAASPFQSGSLTSPHPNLNRFLLPNGEHVACVFWNGLYHITGTDIVRALVFRFEAFSRPVKNIKKFEEGVFSDLRNLKPGTDACLEEPKSAFLDLLFRNGCIRTQKKQKVFYWFSVPHDRLFLDALERDLKREKMGLEPTTVVVGEPARSFRYDPKRSLFEQFAGKQPGLEESLSVNTRSSDNSVSQTISSAQQLPSSSKFPLLEATIEQQVQASPAHHNQEPPISRPVGSEPSLRSPSVNQDKDGLSCPTTANTVLFSRSLLKGSPAYKQGRRKSSREKKQRHNRGGTATTDYDTGEDESGSDSDRLQQADYPFSNPSDDVRHQQPPFVPPPPPIYGDARAAPLTFAASGLSQAVAVGNSASVPTAFSGTHPFPQNNAEIAWTPSLAHVTPDDRIPHLPAYSPMNTASRTPQATIGTQVPGGSSAGPPAKGFSCPLLSCGRLFKRLEHLKRHVRTHTQERPYECTRCAKRFSRSDNLTQHIKTHEKADRGERSKTEASESTEDDIATLLEAEVDAMAAREDRSYSVPGEISKGIEDQYPFAYGDNTSNLHKRFSPVRLPMLPPTQSATTEIATHHVLPGLPFGRGAMHRSDWASPAEPYNMSSTTGLQTGSFLTKRHRSMTPNLPPSGRSSLNTGLGHLQASSYLGNTRFHPYGHNSVGTDTQYVARAASLDPAAFQHRQASVYDQSQNSQDSLRALPKDPAEFAVYDFAAQFNTQPHTFATDGSQFDHDRLISASDVPGNTVPGIQ